VGYIAAGLTMVYVAGPLCRQTPRGMAHLALRCDMWRLEMQRYYHRESTELRIGMGGAPKLRAKTNLLWPRMAQWAPYNHSWETLIFNLFVFFLDWPINLSPNTLITRSCGCDGTL
jgi:hypothetical protein